MSQVFPVAFYRTERGVSPALEWLPAECSKEERIVIGADLRLAQERWPVGFPTCRSLGRGLFEIRSNLPNRIARLLFYFYDGSIVVLHGFIKKTQKTPRTDLNIAFSRMKRLTTG